MQATILKVGITKTVRIRYGDFLEAIGFEPDPSAAIDFAGDDGHGNLLFIIATKETREAK